MWMAEELVALAAKRKEKGQCPGRMVKRQHTGRPGCCRALPHQLSPSCCQTPLGPSPSPAHRPRTPFQPSLLPSIPAGSCAGLQLPPSPAQSGPAPAPGKCLGLGLPPACPAPQLGPRDRPWQVSWILWDAGLESYREWSVGWHGGETVSGSRQLASVIEGIYACSDCCTEEGTSWAFTACHNHVFFIFWTPCLRPGTWISWALGAAAEGTSCAQICKVLHNTRYSDSQVADIPNGLLAGPGRFLFLSVSLSQPPVSEREKSFWVFLFCFYYSSCTVLSHFNAQLVGVSKATVCSRGRHYKKVSDYIPLGTPETTCWREF